MTSIATPANDQNTIAMTKEQDCFLKAVETGDKKSVEEFLIAKTVPAHFQNPNNGTSALMVAAKNGHHELVSLLVQYGAPWNAIDQYGNSAGDYALQAGNQKMVDQLVRIGVQAELLFAALDANRIANKSQLPKAKEKIFIERNVRYEGNALLDDENRGVMMQWEEPLMEAHAQLLCQSKGDVLNIGFGMGYIDTAIQKYPVKSHTIIEAHPQVYKKMIADGWDKKPNVKIVFGRWQDVIGDLGTFDSVFFDTFDDVGHRK